jgi:hypothetical protein
MENEKTKYEKEQEQIALRSVITNLQNENWNYKNMIEAVNSGITTTIKFLNHEEKEKELSVMITLKFTKDILRKTIINELETLIEKNNIKLNEFNITKN